MIPVKFNVFATMKKLSQLLVKQRTHAEVEPYKFTASRHGSENLWQQNKSRLTNHP